MTKIQMVYDQVCDLAHDQLCADDAYVVGFRLALLGLSKMSKEQREAELATIDDDFRHGLEGLDELAHRRSLNGRGKGLVLS